MPLTKDFRKTVFERAQRDASFRRALLQEALEALLAGEVELGKRLVRNYINATVGFEGLAEKVGKPTTSLMRMFGAKGNPSAKNLFAVIAELQKLEGVNITLKLARVA